MTTPPIDYQALFAATVSPHLVLSPDLVILDVNDAFCRAVHRPREDLVRRYLFDAFPENPADPKAEGVRSLRDSLPRVLRTGEPETLVVQKYDIPVPDRPRVFEERWACPINVPVPGPDGQVAWILHRMEDVTDFVLAHADCARPGTALSEREAMEAELYVRAQELQRLNEQLRQAHARERKVAVTLQEAMMQDPDLAGHPNIAVRYLPAAKGLNVCGDWYDVADLPGDGFSVAVGDVVGHGLEAAAVMGMLRSALSAAVRALQDPAKAMEVLGLYARSVEGAPATTAVKAVIDTRRRHIIYTSAGHPPPVLTHPDGTFVLLDRATDPPLGARPQHVPRPQAAVPYSPGDTLVLYTDGLIERRGEDIDAGLQRLIGILTAHPRSGPEHLADTLLSRLGVSGGGADDLALIVVRL
ncbi:PP2C family protein-serine/threonine phosphatase [Streptomyces gibsoniae]|uniref:SpoIIE family protein phosphatase n=1 Tax=Streptomyces gibsoniae TaxID=3075529 RepID=A0ABU2U079_9ACTN|nr:SpoIIE family protein phosphatase [Streptomyces sp. DSM 41699]MDT0466485.1 SpoIIE family protein phosphatase [Streptomyces sp. DSM 41699]